MRWTDVLLSAALLASVSLRCLEASDERSDVGHDQDVHPNVLLEEDADVPDTHGRTDTSRDDYEDADWHLTNSLLDRRVDRAPDRALDRAPDHHGANRASNSSSAQCGESGGWLAPDERCHLVATRPPSGGPQNRCPDVFRCADDVSHWLRENRNRKEQVEELRETVSELQEELRSHRHRVKALETQDEEKLRLDLTFDLRLRAAARRRAEAHTLLRVHAALLHELQLQLRNLSVTARRRAGCTVHAVRDTPPPLGLRDTPPPDGPFLSSCPSDCASLYRSGVRRSGVYTVALGPGATLPVYCDMETEGGGWTVFQRRRDGSVSFNRGWSEYRDGFGEPRGEHWLGNQQLHLLSSQGHYSLRVDLQDWSHAHKHALYHSFRVDDAENHYRLHVSGFSGTVEDSFAWYHDQRVFSTPDTGDICAEVSHAGWWFHQCFYANLNGVYYKGGPYSLRAQNLLGPDGIVWFSWKDSDFYSLKAVAMMIRPRNFRPRLSP